MSYQYSEFGLKARAIMLRKKITMAAIAKEMGVSTAYISDLLRGARETPERRKQIAKILGMEEVC